VRSHAKASTGGSNSGQGTSRGSLRRPGTLVGLLVALLVIACFASGAAFAAETRPPVGSFGPDGTSASTFAEPGAVAVDQGTHDVYVADYGLGTVEKFSETGAPTDFSALGSNEITGFSFFAGAALYEIAVNSTSHDFYVAEFGRIKAFHQNGEPAEFTAGSGASSNELPAVGEFACGVAVDANGDIYMADYETGVHIFKPSGEELTSFSVSEPCNLAVDSSGRVYVSHFVFGIGGVEEFTPSEFPVTASTTYSSPGEVVDPSVAFALAADPSKDHLYVDHSNHVSVFDDTGAFLYEFGGVFAASEGLAVDGGTEQAYVSDSGNRVIQVFGPPVPLPSVVTEDADEPTSSTATLHGTVNPEGKQLTDCRFEFVPASQFEVDQYQSLTPAQQAPCVPDAASIPPDSTAHAVKAEISGLAPDTTYHFRLIAETAEGTANGPDRTLTTAIGPPIIGSQSVEAIGTSDATVSAEINPKGVRTTYHVEYGPTASYGQSTPESLPIGFASDDTEHTVSIHIGGLAPGTAYHFRFVAKSSAGSDEGADATFVTYPAPAVLGPCPNDQFRSGAGARLPDCRAYEQATPIDKHGANPQGTIGDIQASSAGNRVTFFTTGGLPTTGGSSESFMAFRGSAGWSSDGLVPPIEPGQTSGIVAWPDDLSTTFVSAPGAGDTTALYLRDNDAAAYHLALAGLDRPVFLAGFASDTSHLIVETETQLLPSAPAGKINLYALDHGVHTLASRIPAGSATSCDDAGSPACIPAPNGSFAGPYNWFDSNTNEFGGARGRYYTQNTISRDGSRVFFTAAGSGQLYVREDGTTTTRISASQRTVPDPNGPKPAAFMAATPDGSKVFFTSCEKLTDDSTAVSTGENLCTTKDQGQDLYSYDVDSGELTDLTVDSDGGDLKGTAVQGILGASDDGSYVYFVANGVLAPGASPGDCVVAENSTSTCNLYLSHDGVTTFIASLLSGNIFIDDQTDWAGRSQNQKKSRVSADGSTLLFSSIQSLTGYDNIKSTAGGSLCAASLAAGNPCQELFRYDAPSEELSCISCNPTGAPPRGEAVLGTERSFFHAPPKFTFLTRNLSADGNRVFFESPDALLPTDTNGVQDVYEWEAEGSGSCSEAGGCIYLLSSGTSPDPSYFADASASGDHVFMFTAQQLVPTDRDQLVDIYDAGVGAGLPSQHVLAPPTCAGAACQANSPPPPEQTAASALFSGPGNTRRRSAGRKCLKGKRQVRPAGKVRCQKQSKQHKRHNGRGGSK
jgi:hypothetical protein